MESNFAKWLGSVIYFGFILVGSFVSTDKLVCHVCHDDHNCNTENHNDTKIYYEGDRKIHRYGTIKCSKDVGGFHEASHFCASAYTNGKATVRTCMMVQKIYENWKNHTADTTQDCPPPPQDKEVLCACHSSKCTGCCEYPYTPDNLNSERDRLLHVAKYRELPDELFPMMDTRSALNFCSEDKEFEKIAHPRECATYFICLNGTAYEQQCGKDLHFNPNHQRCDAIEKVKCTRT